MAIRVLMVTDGEGSFKQQGMRFGLTELVKALEEGALCTVKRAHRYGPSSTYAADAEIKNFKFDNAQHFNPADYDEIWFVGFASKNPAGPYGDPPGFDLTNAEVGIVAQFMEEGGGVFATGDHDDLGADLCAKLPRVRSMRRWEADYGWVQANLDTFVPDPKKSPPPVGPYRLDTLDTGHNTHYEFQDQSDDVPQTIDPAMETIRTHVTHVAGGEIGFKERMPHPLLCGPDGVINVLPDHMHEGHCLVPEKLDGTFTVNGQTKAEYPVGQNGAQVSPEVVAWATVHARLRDPNFTDPETQQNNFKDSNTKVNATQFPVIVAYNGHRTPNKVGRVVVDATFHHFVNINVTGVDPNFDSEIDPVDPVKDAGFLASPAGQAHYQQIKAYWRNIATWICRPSKLKELAWDVIWDVALDPRLKQTRPYGTVEKMPTRNLVRYGASAWSLMIRRASPCKVISWFFDIAIPDPLSYLLAPWVYIKLTLPDPPPFERTRLDLAVDKIELLYYALGAAMVELWQPQNRKLLASRKPDANRGIGLVQRGALAGLQRGLSEQAARMERTVAALKQTIAMAGKIDQSAV